jgi:DNA repair protein RadC
VWVLPAGHFAGDKETHMTHRSLSKKLAVRSDRGYVVAPPETFSTGFFEQTETGIAPVADSAVIEASLAILAKRVARGSVLSSPSAVKNFLVTRLADLEHEIFGVLLLTTRHHLIDFVELFRGTLDGANVAPREVLKLVLARNAGAVILVHQHPSAVKDASQADELITATLKEALALIQVRVIDHIIVAGRDTLSFAERGLL